MLVVIVVAITLAAINYMGFRDAIFSGIQGTVLMPLHDWSVTTWLTIGNLGFTYIAATTLTIGVTGGLFLVFVVYALFWKKLVQGKILHRKPRETGIITAPLQRTLSTNLSTNVTPPASTAFIPASEPEPATPPEGVKTEA